MPSYHDIHITTKNLPRTSIFDLPYNYMVTCTRAGGWELWIGHDNLVAGEYEENGFRLDCDGHIIVDSLKPK